MILFGEYGGGGQDGGIAQISHMRYDLATRPLQIATVGVLQASKSSIGQMEWQNEERSRSSHTVHSLKQLFSLIRRYLVRRHGHRQLGNFTHLQQSMCSTRLTNNGID